MSRRRLATAVAGAAVLLLCCAVPVQAAWTLTLSTHSSNPPLSPGGGPNIFDATLDFSVVGSTLMLNVSNDTPEIPGDLELDMSEIYFNVANFGDFDVKLEDGHGSKANPVPADGVFTFTFSISGTGTYSDTDFIGTSSNGGEYIPSYAATKFSDGWLTPR